MVRVGRNGATHRRPINCHRGIRWPFLWACHLSKAKANENTMFITAKAERKMKVQSVQSMLNWATATKSLSKLCKSSQNVGDSVSVIKETGNYLSTKEIRTDHMIIPCSSHFLLNLFTSVQIAPVCVCVVKLSPETTPADALGSRKQLQQGMARPTAQLAFGSTSVSPQR